MKRLYMCLMIAGLLLALAACGKGQKEVSRSGQDSQAESAEKEDGSAESGSGNRVFAASSTQTMAKEPESAMKKDTEAKTDSAEIQHLWESFGLGEKAEDILAQALAREDMVVMKDGFAAGRQLLEAFYESTHQGEPGEILILKYYDLTGQRLGVELFLEENPKYPLTYLSRLSFDGEQYHQITRPGNSLEMEEGSSVSYRYFKHFEGETTPSARKLHYEQYVLVNDDSVSWERLEWGMLSSTFGDSIPFAWVASSYTSHEEPPAGSYIPGEAEKGLWKWLNGKEEWNTHFAMVYAGAQPAPEVFQLEDENSLSLLSYWREDRILWRAELPYTILESFPMPEGILLYGSRDEESPAEAKGYYLSCFDTQGKLLWEYRPSITHFETLLAAERVEGNTILAFCKDDYSSSAAVGRQAHLLALDKEGKRLWEHSAVLCQGERVQAACISGLESAYYVLQENDFTDTARIVMVDRQHGQAQEAAHLKDLKAPGENMSLTVRNICCQGTGIYVSAYACPMLEKKSQWFSYRDEVFGIMEGVPSYWAEGASPELMQRMQEKYTALLYYYEMPVRSSVRFPFEAKLIRSYPGGQGGRIFKDGLLDSSGYGQEIAWEIEEIKEVLYSMATSAFSLISRCQVIRYSYSPDMEEGAALFGDEPGSFQLTEKMTAFYR